MKQIVKKFDSVSEYIRYLSNAKDAEVFNGVTHSSTKISKSWSTTSYDDAEKLLRFGDKKNAERISKRVAEVQRINGSGTSRRQTSYNDVVGYAVHVPNYLVGIPATMINSRKVSIRNSKVINIVYNCTFAYDTDLDTVIEAGVKVLTHVRDLEQKGYRVNLYVMLSSRGSSEQITAMVRIKDSEQYMNITKTAYPIVNPNFLRRQFCKLIESEAHDKVYTLDYGRVVHERADVKDIIDSCRIKVDEYLSYYSVHRYGIQTKK